MYWKNRFYSDKFLVIFILELISGIFGFKIRKSIGLDLNRRKFLRNISLASAGILFVSEKIHAKQPP